MHMERMCYSHTTRWALTVMETKWKEVVNRNKKKICIFFSSSNSHYLALQGFIAHYIQEEERSHYLSIGTLKKPKKTKQNKPTHTKNPTSPDHWCQTFADQLRSEIILLHQKIFTYIGITTEFIFDSINRICIYIFSGI